MSTRSNIGLMNEDGTVSVIYCHNDGYLKGVGQTLLNNYKTRDKVEKLIALGSLNSLGEEPFAEAKSWDFMYKSGNYLENYKGCVAQRHRKDCFGQINIFPDVKTWLNYGDYNFAYLFDKDKWKFTEGCNKRFKILTQEIIDKEKY